MTETDNPVALVEGHFDEVSEDETQDRVKSIIDGGEAQFVVHLARKDGVEVISPEPDRLWEANELAKEFGGDAVVFYYLVRQIGWWNTFANKPDMETEATEMLQYMKKSYEWDSVDFSIARMTAIHQELFGKPLPWGDTRWIYGITTPISQEYVTNEIACRSGELRDEYIFGRIQQYWQAGKSPFVVFGSAHAIRLEPALQRLASQ